MDVSEELGQCPKAPRQLLTRPKAPGFKARLRHYERSRLLTASERPSGDDAFGRRPRWAGLAAPDFQV